MSLDMFSSSSDASNSSSPSPKSSSSSKSKVSAWLPISAFIGASLVLAVPVFMIRKYQGTVLRTALKQSDAPLPRRTGAIGEAIRAKPTPTPSTASTTTEAEAKPEFSTPGVGELLSAISSVDSNTALYAGKAFAIATGIIAVFGVTLTLGVKSVMAIEDTKEFGQRMRALLSSNEPSRSSRIVQNAKVFGQRMRAAFSSEDASTRAVQDGKEYSQRVRAAISSNEGPLSALVVQEGKELGHRMQAAVARKASFLLARIKQPPKDQEEEAEDDGSEEEENHDVYEAIAPNTIALEEWLREKAEERLKKAYNEGGYRLWAKSLLRELEAERKAEVASRERGKE